MINCIVAVDRGQGIGFNNQLPWPHLKGDMQWFKEKTTNGVLIMGSKTWQSIGKPLPNRINIVLSKLPNPAINCDHSFTDANVALQFCLREYSEKEIFIIGGESIYNHYMPLVNRFYVTEIDEKFNCDKFFNLDWVKKNCSTVIEHSSFVDPINYKIKEYRI